MIMEAAVAVVDDDEAVRDSLSMMLGNHGFGVCSFSSADAFMAVIGVDNLPSCVVCDRHEAEHVSQEMHMRISAHPSGACNSNIGVTSAEFRGGPFVLRHARVGIQLPWIISKSPSHLDWALTALARKARDRWARASNPPSLYYGDLLSRSPQMPGE